MSTYKETHSLIRNSAPIRVASGTILTTVSASLFAVSHTIYRKHPISYPKNMFKGSILLSFCYFSLNELLVNSTSFFSVYSNYWMNYSLAAYCCSKAHYRYLIRSNRMKWHAAILYSHKCFASLCVISLFMEFFLISLRNVHLRESAETFLSSKTKEILQELSEKQQLPAVFVAGSDSFTEKAKRKGSFIRLSDFTE